MSRAASFEKGCTGVSVLCPNPCVGGWIRHLLSGTCACKWFSMDTVEFNARENPNGWMFGMYRRDDPHMGQFPMDVSEQAKMARCLENWDDIRCMGRVVGN